MTAAPVLHRIWAKVQVNAETGCWEWTGAKNPDGYARVGMNGKVTYPHRVMYEAMVGPIPDGLDIDHLCRVRWCCNPAHLEPVTRRENLLRGEGFIAAHAADRDCGYDGCFTCRPRRRSDVEALLVPTTGDAA